MNSNLLVFAPLLVPLSWLYSWLMRIRAWLYDVGAIPSHSCGAFVVSIGNLQVGGTGKTPISAFFAKRWKEKVRLGIVSRGYGRSTAEVLRVDATHAQAAARFGDEPTLLSLITGVPVQVGQNRVHAAREVIVTEAVRLVLMDDGFQHLRLRRSFDFVLVDVTAPDWHWQVLPWGRMREPWSALVRADAVILTKTESVSQDRLKSFSDKIRKELNLNGRRQVPLIKMQQKIFFDDRFVKTGSTFLVAGVARPENFFQMVKAYSNDVTVTGQMEFADHHDYADDDFVEIVRRAKTSGAKSVTTTEKDAVKLQRLWKSIEAELPLFVSNLSVNPVDVQDEKELERIDAIIFDQLRGLSSSTSR